MNDMITIIRAEYERLREAAEDLADIEAFDRRLRRAASRSPQNMSTA